MVITYLGHDQFVAFMAHKNMNNKLRIALDLEKKPILLESINPEYITDVIVKRKAEHDR